MADYSEICDIQDQRVAEYCKFLNIRMLYVMFFLWYLTSSWTDPTI